MLIEAELLPQGPQFASNIPRFGEEPEKLMKMLPEPDDTILMSDITLMSSQDTVTVIDRLGKDGLTEVMDSVKTAKFYLERIKLYERKGLDGTPKDYLLGIDGKLKESLRENLGLQI